MKGYSLDNEIMHYITLLKDCARKKDLSQGIRLHSDIMTKGLLEKNPYLGSSLISMYAKCGSLEKAEQVFEELPVRDVVSWTSLISGYSQQGLGREAMTCFERMHFEGLSPNSVTYIAALKSCSNTGDLEKGKHIHEEIASKKLLEKDTALGNALIDMYVKFGQIEKAKQVLGELPVRNTISWTTLIAGYANQGHGDEALNCFVCMQNEGVSPNSVTFICLLKACGCTRNIEKGEKLLDEIVRRDLLYRDVALCTALVDMYAKCGAFAKAENVIDELCIRDVACWTALISGYVQYGKEEEALNCFQKMLNEGLSPDVFTFTCILKACGSVGTIQKGIKIHNEISDKGLLSKYIELGSALVDMYAKCGHLAKAENVLSKLPIKDITAWNALITGYTQQGLSDEALKCFEQMLENGLSPDAITYTCILKACGTVGDIDKGKCIHDEILSKGYLKNDTVLGNSLVDMYAKCGEVEKAEEVLNQLLVRNIPSWTAVIAGYAQKGQGREALNCLRQMQSEGLCPNDVTFLRVLNACSHTGLLEEAEMYFLEIVNQYGVTSAHQTCMVDVFGRAGHFEKAMTVIQKMPSLDHRTLWTSLLGACKKLGNVKIGRLAFDQLIQLDVNNSSAYLLMSKIYDSAGMVDDAARIEEMRVRNCIL